MRVERANDWEACVADSQGKRDIVVGVVGGDGSCLDWGGSRSGLSIGSVYWFYFIYKWRGSEEDVR